MIQAYADGGLFYDSRLGEYLLTGLSVTAGLNKSGTASIVMPPNHPAYNAFTGWRTLVEIYKNGKLKFRGRALNPAEDFERSKVIVCEGERGFFRDSAIRPYLYQDTPANIFTDLVTQHNTQVEAFKQFVVGTITVTDANDYVRMESSEAEKTSVVLDKLVERCGGYVTFTTNTAGQRVIHWLAELGYRSSQTIEFGQNLLDFSRSDGSTGPVTRLIPYGAKDQTTGERLTIESVNGGLDYIQDDLAVQLRGIITDTVVYDDVTVPENLLTKATQHLETAKKVITSLQLTAIDLSDMDRSIDDFEIGDLVQVVSRPHGLDEDFLLTDRTENLLQPDDGKVILGKELTTLTGSDVAADRQNESTMKRIEQNIVSDYQINTAAKVEELRDALTSLIKQTSDSIKLEVSEQYATADGVGELISTSMTQLSDSFEFLFTELSTTVDDNDAAARGQFEEIKKYIRFVDGDILLGESGNEITLRIENDRISFRDGGAEVAYFSNKQLVVLDANFLNSLRIGNFAWVPRTNGNLSLVKVGD